MNPNPNYYLCTDPQDSIQLTDGQYASTHLWKSKSSVGWHRFNNVQITLDLEDIQPIDDVVFSTAFGIAQVSMPCAIVVLVSDDNQHFKFTKNMLEKEELVYGRYKIRKFRASGLRTKGRYVLIGVVTGGGRYLFCDEIEVYPGKHSISEVNTSNNKVFERSAIPKLLQEQGQLVRKRNRIIKKFKKVKGLLELLKEKGLAGRSYDLKSKLQAIQKDIENSQLDSLYLDNLDCKLCKLYGRMLSLVFSDESYVVWHKNLWEPLAPLEIPSIDNKDLEVFMMVNEYESAAFIITNTSEKDLLFKITISDLKSKDEKNIFPKQLITIREVAFVESASYEIVADPLIPIEGNIVIPAGQTKQIWLTLHSKGVFPGDYYGKISIVASSEATQKQINFHVRVYPIQFPDQISLSVINWSYLTFYPVKGLEKEAVDDLFAHYTNIFVMHQPYIPWPICDENGDIIESLNFDKHDKFIQLHDGFRQILFFMNFKNKYRRDLNGQLVFMSKSWKKAFKEWVLKWILHLKDLGLSYNQFAFYLFDEPREKQEFEMLAEVCDFLDKIDPKIKVYVTLDSPIAFENLKLITPYIDIWQIQPNVLRNKSIKRFFEREQKERDKQVWIYGTEFFPPKSASPYKAYRLKMWKAYNLGFSGAGFWSYSDTGWEERPGTAWNDFDGTYPDYAVIYGWNRGFISSKRWEAWREGIEDYEYLNMVNKEFAEILVKEVLKKSDTPQLLDEMRKKVLNMIKE